MEFNCEIVVGTLTFTHFAFLTSTDSSLTQEMFDSDDDDHPHGDGQAHSGGHDLDNIENEESQWRKLRLEKEEFIDSQSQQIG